MDFQDALRQALQMHDFHNVGLHYEEAGKARLRSIDLFGDGTVIVSEIAGGKKSVLHSHLLATQLEEVLSSCYKMRFWGLKTRGRKTPHVSLTISIGKIHHTASLPFTEITKTLSNKLSSLKTPQTRASRFLISTMPIESLLNKIKQTQPE